MTMISLRSTTALRSSLGLFLLLAAGGAWAEDAAPDEVLVLGNAILVAPSAPPLDATQPTSKIEKEFIQNNIIPLASFDDIVKFAPSVWDQSPNGPGLGKSETLSIRGFQDSQFNVTFDGIPFGDASDLHHTTSAMFIAHDIGEASVDRGPGSAATIGNATFGGTLGFNTKNPLDTRTINAYGTVGSFDTKAVGVEYDTGTTSVGRVFIDGQRETSDGYLTHADEDRKNLMAKDVWAINNDVILTAVASYNHAFEYTTGGATAANIQAFGPDFGLSGNPKTQAYYGYQPSNYYSDFEYIDLQANLGGGWSLKNTVYTDAFEHDYIESTDASQTNPIYNGVTFYSASGAKLKPQPAGAATDSPGKYADARFRAFGDITRLTDDLPFGQLQFGVWVDRNDDKRLSQNIDVTANDIAVGSKYGTPYSYDFTDSLTTVQPYAELDWQVTPDLAVTPGVRLAYFDRDLDALYNKIKPPSPAHYSESWDMPLPSVAAHYSVAPDWTAYAQIAQGFLAPPISVLETASAPPSIKPEITWNYQIGTSARRQDWVIGLDAYYIDFSNFITSATSGGVTSYVNGGGAIYQGAEAELQYVLGRGFSLYGNASFNDAKYKRTDVHIALTPQWTASSGILYNDAAGPYFSVVAKWIGARYGNDLAADGVTLQNSVGLQPYVTADFAGGWRFKDDVPALSDLTISLKVSNIFDETKINGYAGTQSATNTPLFWTTPGRSAFLNLSVSY